MQNFNEILKNIVETETAKFNAKMDQLKEKEAAEQSANRLKVCQDVEKANRQVIDSNFGKLDGDSDGE